jgi:hypothetical protein
MRVKGLFSAACPIPCTKSELMFGFPFKSKDGTFAYGKFYFKSAGYGLQAVHTVHLCTVHGGEERGGYIFCGPHVNFPAEEMKISEIKAHSVTWTH